MDYIIFGLGAGATLLLVGWLFRDYGPWLRDRNTGNEDHLFSAQQLMDQMGWSRFCRASGTAVALGGGLLLLATFLLVVLQVSDGTGALVLGITFAVVLIGVLLWAGMYTSRFGLQGIYRAKAAKETPAVIEEDAYSFLNDNDDEDDPQPEVTDTKVEYPLSFRELSAARKASELEAEAESTPDSEPESDLEPEQVSGPSIPGGVSRFRSLRKPFELHHDDPDGSAESVEQEDEVATVRELSVEDVLHLPAEDVGEAEPTEEAVSPEAEPESADVIDLRSVEDVLGLPSDETVAEDGARPRTLEEILGMPTQAELDAVEAPEDETVKESASTEGRNSE